MQSARFRGRIGLHWFNFLKSSKADNKNKSTSQPAPSSSHAEQDANPAASQPEGDPGIVSRNEDDGSEAATSPNGNTAASGGGGVGPQVEFSLPKDK